MDYIDFDQSGRTIKKRLFKYYPLRDYHIEAFFNDQLFFAKPFSFNDAFDTSDKLIEPFNGFREAIKWDDKKSGLLNTHGIVSFIEDDDAKNGRMWSFYAGNFNGFVLQFDSSALSKKEYYPIHLIPVKYLHAPLNLDDFTLRLRINECEFSIQDVVKNVGFDRLLLDRLFHCIHLEKDSNIWEEENEWRMILGDVTPQHVSIKEHKNGYLLKMTGNSIQALFIGYRVSLKDRQTLLSIAYSKGIECFLATPKIINNQWDIDIVPLYL
ncbi:MAG: DUF2971 domain-containing protein [Bacteroidales bacterium]|nr:DUF2971 domain-containing protein [Bacteroidales bacterium]